MCLSCSESEDVGFEEHVFLDHLLEEGFPKKGMSIHAHHKSDVIINNLLLIYFAYGQFHNYWIFTDFSDNVNNGN